MNDIYTFYKLISEYKIEIPVIQRDYAQGRDDSQAKDIRSAIVKNLLAAVTDDNKKLFFDFVYGRIDGDRFIPFDGQQRLTTLFLFHLYVFEQCKSKSACQFRDDCQCKTLLSRFSYTTRTSSKEFCSCLVNNSIIQEKESISIYVKNQPWFYQDWEKDPTINGMLAMLDEIEKQCQGIQPSEYHKIAMKLTSGCICPISFHFVNMGRHKMSDSTYIKMNARGKALTSFENFKASLEEYLNNKLISEKTNNDLKDNVKKIKSRFVGYYDESKHIQTGIDGFWLDLFYEESKPGIPDLLMLSLFRRHFLNSYVAKNGKDEKIISAEEKQMSKDDFIPFEIYEKIIDICSVNILFPLFSMLDFLYANRNDTMKNSLPMWYRDDFKTIEECNSLSKQDKDSYDSNVWNLFKGIWRDGKEEYSSRIAFYALCKYFEVKTQYDVHSLGTWMRVVWNYVANVQYDNFDDYSDDINLIDAMSVGLNATSSFYEWLSTQDSNTLKYRESRLNEEFIKASLLFTSPSKWENRIYGLEKHKYFTGEIKFIFDFLSQNPSEQSFDNYSSIMQLLFDANGLDKAYDQNGDFIFRRALLYFTTAYSYGYTKKGNWSFLRNKDRDISWKRFISDDKPIATGEPHNNSLNSMLRYIVDKANSNAITSQVVRSAFLDCINHSANISDWRILFIEHWELWQYMGEDNYIRWHNENHILPMKKTQLNGAHIELRTYCLFVSTVCSGVNGWTKKYHEPSTTDLPCIFFEKSYANHSFEIDICWDIDNGNGFYLKFLTTEPTQNSLIVSPLVTSNPTWKLQLIDPNNADSGYMSACFNEQDIMNLASSIMQSL